MSAAGKRRLRGYRSVSDVCFNLDGTPSACIGWVLFEADDTQRGHVSGVIGTFNNHATLVLLRLARDRKPCSIHGRFDDGQTDASEWKLDDVAYTGAEVHDELGLSRFVPQRSTALLYSVRGERDAATNLRQSCKIFYSHLVVQQKKR